jgi:hypothetical protein
MGLDITAVRRAVFDHETKDSCDHWPEEIRRVYANPDFPGRADGLVDGCYRYESRFDFRAGSYSGYNQWRHELCRLALGCDPSEVWRNREQHVDSPFVELIDFSDCEGVIGPVTSARLLADFEFFAEAAERHAARTALWWFHEGYDNWTRAFRMAAGDETRAFPLPAGAGFVMFH